MFPLLLLACASIDDEAGDVGLAPPDSVAPDPAESAAPADSGGAGSGALVFEGAPPRNLLLISIDTLRLDRVTPETMPQLLGRAEEGFSLSAHRSCSSWTYAAMICALSGLRNTDLGFIPAPSGTEVEPLPDDARLLAQVLADEGFHTELISTTPFLGAAYNMHRGYASISELEAVDAEVILPEVETAILALPSDQPWFLHTHLMDPHSPYDPPEGYADPTLGAGLPWDLRSQSGIHEMASAWPGLSAEEQAAALAAVNGLYAGELLHLDGHLGRIWDALENAGQLDDALILVMSDHGEQFDEHGSWFHGASLYSEESAALAFFWSPRLVSGEATYVTGHEDLAPTALQALGIGASALGGAGLGADEGERRWMGLKADQDKIVLTVERADWRLHYWWSGARALYDLGADPGEQDDRYADEPERVDALWVELAPEVERVQELLPGYLGGPVNPEP